MKEVASAENQQTSKLSAEARQLVASAKRGILTTLLPNDGRPYSSLVDLLPLPNGDVVMFLSKLAEHRRYLEADSRASIFIAADLMADDAISQPRITLVGAAHPVADRTLYAAGYVQIHPGARGYINFADFQFFRFQVEKARFIAGFGRMGWLTGKMYGATAVPIATNRLEQ